MFYGTHVNLISLTPMRKVWPPGADLSESREWSTELRADFLTEFYKNLSLSFTSLFEVQIHSATHFRRFPTFITKLNMKEKYWPIHSLVYSTGTLFLHIAFNILNLAHKHLCSPTSLNNYKT